MALTYKQEINRIEKYCKANLPQALGDEIEAYTDLETENSRTWRLFDPNTNQSYRVTLNLTTKECRHQVYEGDRFKR